MSTLEHVAARIHADFAELLSIVGNAPSPDLVVGNLDHIKTIEQACNIKAAFDSLVAYSADQAINRQLITADTATDFLMDELNLSFQEANNRLRRGYVDHAPLPQDTVEPEAAEMQREQARQKAIDAHISASKLNTINQALDNLRDGTTPARHDLYLQAVNEAEHRNDRDLKTWVTKAVRRANKTVAADPQETMKKRRFTISSQDTDGNHPFYGTMTAAQQAVITAAITPLSHRGSLVNVSDKEDTRSLAERRMDALAYICEQHLKATSANDSYGIASLVISTTADELAHLTAATELPTNTGTLLNPIEAAALLGSPYDFLAIHDLDNPGNLNLQRTRRNATAWRKLALFVQELVCSHPGCDAPAITCDQHHIDAWSFGGTTDLINLTLQCRHHHRFNDDTKTNTQRGYATRFTDGDKRVGYADPEHPDTVLLNTTSAHDECAAEKLRCQRRQH